MGGVLKPISPSELKERITLQQQTLTPDGSAGFTKAWVDVATIWAKAWTVSSTEGVAGAQTTMIRVQKFAIRYRGVLRSSWRIKWGVRYFNITGIDPDDKSEFIFLTCKEAGG
jgi:SPP1 family predicted phage head-tail adaptor